MVRTTRMGLLTLLAAALLVLGVGGASAATTTTIDFETLTGPSTFCPPAAGPLAIGDATFTGGVVLTATANLPANQSSVYGTASFCTGYADTITIDFARPVSNFSVQVLNGLTSTVSYTVESDTGDTDTRSLLANFSSGEDTFELADPGITSVSITPTTPSTLWDFFIDDVTFTAFPVTTAECKKGGWEAYGVFKNQGDCVSYVATGGRNEPAG